LGAVIGPDAGPDGAADRNWGSPEALGVPCTSGGGVLPLGRRFGSTTGMPRTVCGRDSVGDCDARFERGVDGGGSSRRTGAAVTELGRDAGTCSGATGADGGRPPLPATVAASSSSWPQPVTVGAAALGG
jgi:hypothetical protein